MNSNKKKMNDENTLILSSSENQENNKSPNRPFIRDTAMVAAGLASGVVGTSYAQSYSNEETEKADVANSTTTNANPVTGHTDTSATDSAQTGNAVPDTTLQANNSQESQNSNETTQHESVSGQSVNVNEELSFDEAFAEARRQAGPGGVFSYHGRLYNTYYKEEWENMSQDQKNDYYASISDMHPSGQDNFHPQNEISNNENPQITSNDDQNPSNDEIYVLGVGATTIEGQEVYVAHLSVAGEDVVILDVDKDGAFDYAVADLNSDGQISENEIGDISDKNITLAQMQEATQHQHDVFAEDPTLPDYTNDADISHFA